MYSFILYISINLCYSCRVIFFTKPYW